MWASLCNFLYGKLFYKPEVKAPTSSSDSAIDPVYGKRLKLSHSDLDTNGLLNQTQTPQRFAMQAKKYLTGSDDEDECRVVAEIHRRKNGGPSSTIVSARVSVIKKTSSVRDGLSSPSPFQRQASQMRNESKGTAVLRSKTYSERATHSIPTLNHPTSSHPMSNHPIPNRTRPNQPISSRPTFNQPISSRPTFNQPISSRPTFNQPISSRPTFNQPISSQPTFNRTRPNQPISNCPTPIHPLAIHPIPNQPISNRPIPNNPAPNRSHKIFNTQRASLTHSTATRSRAIYKHHSRRNSNSFEEGYRLTEKFQYMRLIHRHSSDAFLPATLSNMHRQLEEVDVVTIPIVDLTGEEDSEDTESDMRSTPDLPVVTQDDSEVEFVEEIPAVRSFQDMIKIIPIAVIDDEDDEETLTNVLESSPEEQHHDDSEHDAVTIDDDEDEDGQGEGDREGDGEEEEPGLEWETHSEGEHPFELSPEQEEKVKEAFRPGFGRQVVAEGFGLRITKRDISTLSEFNWVNDQIINFYLNLIMDRSKRNRALPRVYAFNTFFYIRLAADGHEGLKRWTKTVDLFSFDLIFVPVHLGFHWCLSSIDFRNKSVKYYDSIGTCNYVCMERLLLYIKNESWDKRRQILSVNDWTRTNVINCPQQMNGSDCGVFVCTFAERLARNCDFVFSQENMPNFRKKIAIEILEKKLLT